jgi:hypothetical protein
MKKSVILLLCLLTLLSSCNDKPIESGSEVNSENSTITSEASIDVSSKAEDFDIPGLSYVSNPSWYPIQVSNTVHNYDIGGEYGLGISFTYLHMAGQTELPIDVNEAFSIRISTIRNNENLTNIITEESIFQGYPCIYITATYDYEPSSDPQVDTHFNQYILCVVANDGLYVITWTTTGELDICMNEYNEVIESIVITPI